MYRIGIDVGSTYTKYCIVSDGQICSLFMEKTPIRQKEYFDNKIALLLRDYPGAEFISCGYGKKNVSNILNINELTALAKGVYEMTNQDSVVLDVGGQDTKIISQIGGKLKGFFVNDKCAAGSGMFLANTLDMIGISFEDISLLTSYENVIQLASTCAVFAQSEIVELVADNKTEDDIYRAVLWQIFVKAKPLLSKVEPKPIIISGGLSQIKGIAEFANAVLGRECIVVENGAYLASIGCAMI
ncbi:CoA-substrate-specific enzyme activase, putative [Lachnospiraceae bacterium KHCPX20]|nr:CoA-substrate-specific enzyme activase, putative [Lachnospiraceae bacterium KHCPX20]